MSKSARYYYDADAIREQAVTNGSGGVCNKENSKRLGTGLESTQNHIPTDSRNKRSVWTIPTEPTPEAHFATFPKKLVEPCILSGTSEKGCCPECGAAWERAVERERVMRHELPTNHPDYRPGRYTVKSDGSNDYAKGGGQAFNFSTNIGWQPGCGCGHEPVPCTVLDPFMGSGTVAKVALRARRHYIGIELNAEYIELAEQRIAPLKAQGILL